MQAFLHGPIKLYGSLILFAVLQLPVMKQKFKLNLTESRNLSPGIIFQNGLAEHLLLRN